MGLPARSVSGSDDAADDVSGVVADVVGDGAVSAESEAGGQIDTAHRAQGVAAWVMAMPGMSQGEPRRPAAGVGGVPVQPAATDPTAVSGPIKLRGFQAGPRTSSSRCTNSSMSSTRTWFSVSLRRLVRCPWSWTAVESLLQFGIGSEVDLHCGFSVVIGHFRLSPRAFCPTRYSAGWLE